MIPGLKVIRPGMRSTVQDLGRVGFRDVGVPLSGPLDRVGLLLANALVGNPTNGAVLELLVQGPALEVLAPSVRLALVGGASDLCIETENGRKFTSGRSVLLQRGERFSIGPLGITACAYLAVEGGFAVATCLGSASTYARGAIGGFYGRPLRETDVLPVQRAEASSRGELALNGGYDPGFDQAIRVVLGPQDHCFTDSAVRTLLSAEFTIAAQSDRMAFRLDGPKLAHAAGYNIVSDGIVPGAIQVLGSGQPIVLLADAHTVGGYAKIATVISVDVPVLGRRVPGSSVRFVAITRERAESLRREQDRTLRQWIKEFQSPRELPQIDLAALYSSNLIDGVVDAYSALPG
jgi:allophanate hydrolase